MPIIQGFEVDQRTLDEMKIRGETAKVCAGCGLAMGASRDSRKDWYCVDCIPKVTRLSRYTNPGYNPTPEEKHCIFASFKRAA